VPVLRGAFWSESLSEKWHFHDHGVFCSFCVVEEEKSSYPSEFQRRTLWRAVTGVAILILGALLVGLVWLTSSVLGYLQPVLVPLAVAGIVAYLLDPVVLCLQKKGLSRIQGIVAVFVAFLLFVGGVSWFVGAELSGAYSRGANSDEKRMGFSDRFSVEKVAEYKTGGLGWIGRWFYEKDQDVALKHLKEGGAIVGPQGQKWRLSANGETLQAGEIAPSPELASFLRSDWADDFEHEGQKNAADIVAYHNFALTKGGSMITGFGTKTFSWLMDSSGKILGFFGVIIGLAMVPIYLYYFLKESDSIKTNWGSYVPLKSSSFKTAVVETLGEINGYLISFFRGQVLVAFIDGILVGVALTIFGLNYGLLIGVCMAFLGIIPYVGNILCLLPACLIAYSQKPETLWYLPQWGAVLGVVLIFVVVQQINSLVTAPKIVGDSVGLHPMTVIFSMLFWSLILGGILGALLAVPLTAAVKVLFMRYVWDQQVIEGIELRAAKSSAQKMEA